jgi:hypothetical protein
MNALQFVLFVFLKKAQTLGPFSGESWVKIFVAFTLGVWHHPGWNGGEINLTSQEVLTIIKTLAGERTTIDSLFEEISLSKGMHDMKEHIGERLEALGFVKTAGPF